MNKKLKKIKDLIVKTAKNFEAEFSVLTCSDSNNNKYYYFHFKPRGKDSSFGDSLAILKKNKIRYCIAQESLWKSLIFVPFDQKLNFLIEDNGESVLKIVDYEK